MLVCCQGKGWEWDGGSWGREREGKVRREAGRQTDRTNRGKERDREGGRRKEGGRETEHEYLRIIP